MKPSKQPCPPNTAPHIKPQNKTKKRTRPSARPSNQNNIKPQIYQRFNNLQTLSQFPTKPPQLSSTHKPTHQPQIIYTNKNSQFQHIISTTHPAIKRKHPNPNPNINHTTNPTQPNIKPIKHEPTNPNNQHPNQLNTTNFNPHKTPTLPALSLPKTKGLSNENKPNFAI